MHALCAAKRDPPVVILQSACAADFGGFAVGFCIFANLVEERARASGEVDEYDSYDETNDEGERVDMGYWHWTLIREEDAPAGGAGEEFRCGPRVLLFRRSERCAACRAGRIADGGDGHAAFLFSE